MFNNTTVSISIKRFEELIRTETKYNYLYSLLLNHFKYEFNGICDYLDDIDLNKFKELTKDNKDDKEVK